MTLLISVVNTAQAQQSEVKINYNIPDENLIVEYSFNETKCSTGASNSQFGGNSGAPSYSKYIPKEYRIDNSTNININNGYEEIPCTGIITIPIQKLLPRANNDSVYFVMKFSNDNGTLLNSFAFDYNKIFPSFNTNNESDTCAHPYLTSIGVTQMLFVNIVNNTNTLYEITDCNNPKTLSTSYTAQQSFATQQKKSGSNPPPPPTFGKDSNYKQIVESGFCFNGNCVDVDNYHTEFPLINATVGEKSNITVKAYNPNGLNGLKWIQVVLGIPEIGSALNDGEVINTFYLHQSGLDKIEIVDKENLIGNSLVTTDIVPCGYVSSECLELSFDFIPRDELKNNVVAINVVNDPRASNTNFINDGIEFLGESLNVPLESQVAVSKGGAFYPQERGTVTLTLINYKTDSWQDEYGYLWTIDNYESFRIVDTIPVPQRTPDLEWAAMTRMNSNFVVMVQDEQNGAEIILEKVCPHCNDLPFAELYNMAPSENVIRVDRADDPELQMTIILEQNRAQLILDNAK